MQPRRFNNRSQTLLFLWAVTLASSLAAGCTKQLRVLFTWNCRRSKWFLPQIFSKRRCDSYNRCADVGPHCIRDTSKHLCGVSLWVTSRTRSHQICLRRKLCEGISRLRNIILWYYFMVVCLWIARPFIEIREQNLIPLPGKRLASCRPEIRSTKLFYCVSYIDFPRIKFFNS